MQKTAGIREGGTAPELLTSRASSMADRESFGPRLRAERERRGISLDTIASVTKVGADLWEGLERNDFSRWPSGIFARAFVRDYARAIGLDADEAVNEFCRLFPIGDRRSSRIIQAQAQLIGHDLACAESGAIPLSGDRRARPKHLIEEAAATRARYVGRALATTLDSIFTLSITLVWSKSMSLNFLAIAGVVTIMYYTVMTIAIGTSPGLRIVEFLRHRLPSRLEVADRRRAHA
jgi:transcriptional regulator with XRE-family HTH domain